MLRLQNGKRLDARLTCFDEGGARTSCGTGAVRTAELQPVAVLQRGRSYVAVVDPAGAGPIRDRAGNATPAGPQNLHRLARTAPRQGDQRRCAAGVVSRRWVYGTPSDGVIVADRMTKSYGASRGVVELTFTVRPGEVFGFLGPNGAGKSTTIRTMLDFIRPTSGAVSVFGMVPRDDAPCDPRRAPATCPASSACTSGCACVPTWMRSPHSEGARPRADRSAGRAAVAGPRPTDPTSCPTATSRRSASCRPSMHEPELLILDEPTQGLDPLVQQTFYELLARARARAAARCSSPRTSCRRSSASCDRVGDRPRGPAGRRSTTVGGLKEKALRSMIFDFAAPVDASVFRDLLGVGRWRPSGGATRLAITVQGSVDEVVKEAARHTVQSTSTPRAEPRGDLPARLQGRRRSHERAARRLDAHAAPGRDRLGDRSRGRRDDVRGVLSVDQGERLPARGLPAEHAGGVPEADRRDYASPRGTCVRSCSRCSDRSCSSCSR